MKVENNLQDLKTQGEFEAVGFGIDASALAFKILSGSIYSDPILAIVRELSANAIDAHTEANNVETPFVIDAPNNLRQFFRIRDYGIGLSKEDVTTLYTRYFRSTKTKSNDLIGCMGLGSKTPFAYVDNFSVTSYFNGNKYAFTAFKNEQGTPSVALLGSSKTKEPNGLEIEFPVKQSDIRYFQEKIKTTLQFFKQRPKVTGIPDFKFDEFEYFVKNDSFGVLKSRANESWVIMGNIGYPLESSRFVGDLQLGDHEDLVDWGVHLFVPIGAVEIAASREELSYTPKTLKVLKSIIVQASNQVEEESKKIIDSQVTNLWQARLMASKISDNVVGTILNRPMKWNGVEVDYRVNAPKDTKLCMATSYTGMSRRHAAKVICDEKCHYFINDCETGGFARIRHYLSQNNRLRDDAYVFPKDLKDHYIDEIGFRDVLIYTSTLDEPPKTPREKKKYVPRTGPRPSRIQFINNYFSLENADVNLEDGGIYVVKSGKHYEYFPNYGSHSYKTKPTYVKFYNVIQHLKALNYFGFKPKVFVIKQSTFKSKKFQKVLDKWTPFQNHVYESFKSIPQDKLQILNETHTYNQVKSQNEMRWLEDASSKNWDKLPQDSLIVRAIEAYKRIRKAYHSAGRMDYFEELNAFCENIHKTNVDKNIVDLLKDASKKYPMLSLIYNYPRSMESIYQYVELIDLDEEFKLDQKIA